MYLIRFYQKTLSPDHGVLRVFHPNGYCRFSPTCSDYGYGAFKTHGFLKGAIFSVKRLLRCHPWAKGGIDPVPK